MLEKWYASWKQASFLMAERVLVDSDLGAHEQGFKSSPFGNMILKPKVVGFTGILGGKIGEK